MADEMPRILRPHERRALQARLETSDEDPLGHIVPPSMDTIEALEAHFPMTLPENDLRTSNIAEVTFGQVQRQLGQQDVIRFLRNLAEKTHQQGA